MTLNIGFKAASARMTPSIVARRPCRTSFFPCVCGLMEMPQCQRDGLADKPNDRRSGLRIRRIVSGPQSCVAVRDTLSDAKQRAHLEVGDFLFVQNFDGKAPLPWPSLRLFAKIRASVCWKLVDEVTRKILRVGMTRPFERPFSPAARSASE